MLSKIVNYLILALLFLLPWQTRWIYGTATLNGQPWEYGTLCYYGSEILLWLIVILTGIGLFSKKDLLQKIFTTEHFKKRWPFLILGVLLAFVGGYSVAISPVQDISIQFISRFIGVLCLTLCLGLAELPFNRMVLFFWSGGVVQGFIAIFQFFTQEVIANKWFGLAAQLPSGSGVSVVQTEAERWLRAYGSFGSPNALGIYLAIILLIGFIFRHQFKTIASKWFPAVFLGGQMIVFSGLILSFSRSAWIAFFSGIIAYLIMAKIKKLPKIIFIGAYEQIISFVLIVSALIIIYPSLFFTRFANNTYLENISLSDRLSQVQTAGQVIASNPINGVGSGLYTYYLAVNFKSPTNMVIEPVHNIYLLSLSEIGIPLFILLSLFIIWLIRIIIKKNPFSLAIIIALLIAGLFDHFLWSMYVGQVLFWTVFGLSIAKNNLNEEVRNLQ